MRIEEISIYTIEELSENAKEYAHNKYCNEDQYVWGSENRETMNEFEKTFPVKVRDWSYDTCSGHVNFSMTCDDEIEELSGIRLSTYLWNNYGSTLFRAKTYWKNMKRGSSKCQVTRDCNLTGYGIDEDILDPIYDFMKKPDDRNFRDLMRDCFDSWVKACSRNMEDYYSMESFIETSKANEWEYLESGEFH